MIRVIVSEPGGHEALELVESASARRDPSKTRVFVKACGVNYADCIVRMGHYEAARKLYPITPGFEFAGETESGRKVFGITRFGGYASEIDVHEDQLWDLPGGWSFEQGAAFPAVHMTAWWGLHETARVRKGERILVHSAAGGAGSAFVILGRLAGCHVTGVVGSPEKMAKCPADRLLLRSQLWPEGETWDAIFDANGGTLKEGYERLAAGGRLVAYGFADLLPRGKDRLSWLHAAKGWLKLPRFNPLHMTGRNRGVLGFNVVYMFDKLAAARAAMAQMLRDCPPPAQVTAYPMKDVARAHADLESGKTTGKLVLLP